MTSAFTGSVDYGTSLRNTFERPSKGKRGPPESPVQPNVLVDPRTREEKFSAPVGQLDRFRKSSNKTMIMSNIRRQAD
jgi:hypothetical protein